METEDEMNWTLEVVVVPVVDLDRSKAFYRDRLGFHPDHDYDLGEGRRVVQLTPPGSGCSIVFGTGGVVVERPPGNLGNCAKPLINSPRNPASRPAP